MKKKIQDSTEEFGINLSDQAHTYKEKFFRNQEIKEVISHIETGNNILLVGKKGCGIDTIIKGIVKDLSSQANSDLNIFQMTINDFLINTRYTGELETRLKKIVDYFKNKDRKSIIYFPEIHLSLGAGASVTDPHGDIASRLPFFLSQKEIQIIGSTTPSYLKILKRRSHTLLNNFVILEMKDMPEESTIEILKDYIRITKNEFMDSFNDLNLKRIIRKSEKMFALKSQPGAAINLLQNMLSNMNSSDKRDFEEAFSYTLSTITGIREDFFDNKRKFSVQDIIHELRCDFFGQEHAVRKVASILIRMKANLSPDYRPSGVMFFVGPTGVGKTELAKCVARYLLGDKRKLKIYDMSEYSHHESIFSLIGHPNDTIFQTLQSRGKFVDDALTEPYSIFLLDEIEKCHEKVIYLLLQVTGEGRLKDSTGDSASFLNSIIIMTSNVGFSKPGKMQTDDAVISELERTFPPEFINRIEHIVTFGCLSDRDKEDIAKKELDEALKREGIKEKSLTCEYDNELIKLIAQKGYSEKYNARGIQRTIEELVIYPLSDYLSVNPVSEKTLYISVADEEVKIDVR